MYGESDGRLSISKPIRVNPSSLMGLLAFCCEIDTGRYPVPVTSVPERHKSLTMAARQEPSIMLRLFILLAA